MSCKPEESNQLFSLRHFKEFWVAVEREKGEQVGFACVCAYVCVWVPGVCSFLRGWDVVR